MAERHKGVRRNGGRGLKETTKFMMIALIVILLSAGLFFILKPKFIDYANLNKQQDLIQAIEEGQDSIDIILSDISEETDYYSIDFNEDSNITVTPVPSDISPDTEMIRQVSGIGIMEIEKIDLKLPIVEGVQPRELNVAIGHLSSSANIGEEGNCIIAGHRNYTYGTMFNRLDEVSAGDIIQIITIDGTEYKYKVYALTVVEQGSELLFECDEGQHKLTLLTCTPVRKATHRLLVMAELIE
jgi:sortase A